MVRSLARGQWIEFGDPETGVAIKAKIYGDDPSDSNKIMVTDASGEEHLVDKNDVIKNVWAPSAATDAEAAEPAEPAEEKV